MDALKAAAREGFDLSCEELRIAISGLDAAALQLVPAPEANSLTTLVRHAASSTRYLLTCAVTGHGDRAHYRAVTRAEAFAPAEESADSLIGLIDALEEDGRRLIDEFSIERIGDPVTLTGSTDPSPSRASMLLLALQHLREHVGHAQLTRQIATGT